MNSSDNSKDMIYRHFKALDRFRKWENTYVADLAPEHKLAAVFEIYERIPENARNRCIHTEGVMEMHRKLACLK